MLRLCANRRFKTFYYCFRMLFICFISFLTVITRFTSCADLQHTLVYIHSSLIP